MTPRVLLQDGAAERWLAFSGPVAVLETRRPAAVRPLLAEATRRVEREGVWAAGFLAYEAAPAFDPALAAHPPGADGPPLLWLGLYASARPASGPGGAPEAETAAGAGGAYRLGPWRPSLDRAGYRRAIAEIKRRIAAGDTYQVNFTYRLTAPFAGDPAAFFADLVAAQRPAHAALVDTGRFVVCSASPELFFALDGERLTARPMKGTSRRGLGSADDRERARRLRASAKERAENLMIVDMLRNDLGRVAEPGSVAVPELFRVERYPTVLQMTSTVTAASRAPADEIVAALFPCASITGAPKVATSRIIASLEDRPRGVYTGAIGYLAPGRRARFNVAIRTAVVDRRRGEAVYGVGGGVVWDSDAEAEHCESELKARVVTAAGPVGRLPAQPEFELLETLRWSAAEGWTLLADHLERLAGSAEYFGFALDRTAVERRLDELAAKLGVRRPEETREPSGNRLAGAAGSGDAGSWVGAWRVRLLVARDGGLRTEALPLTASPIGSHRAATDRYSPAASPEDGGPLRVALARAPIDPADPFLYHKTTHREVYERALAGRSGYDDVLLWNPAGEATESTLANLLVLLDGRWVTPPVAAGLLPGTARARLLAEGAIRELPVPLADLERAEAMELVNSVRGRYPVTIDPAPPSSRPALSSRPIPGPG